MIKNHAELFASRSFRRRALSLCLLWVFAATLPVLAQDKAAQLMAGESLGGIKIGMAEKKLTDLLGQPKKKGQLKLTEATSEYDQTWFYPDKGLEITLSARSKTGAKTVTSFTASTGCGLTTTKGIKIGSAEADVRKAYGSFEDKEDASKNSFVAGSIYGGIIFTFKDKKVTRIFFGAAAE
ncbi:MAG TPA: hypothetical protein VK581_13955 [Chthoniobacterales bacterium]|nr:hypothetical protein [Chthoniobacterales bacterium]